MSQTRCAVVTGGASGIGLATAERLLGAGWSVVIADLNAETAAAALATCTGRFGPDAQVAFVPTDVSREEDITAAVDRATDTFGRLDCMINNAGIGGAFGPVTDIEAEDWDATFAVLVRAVFLGTKHAVRVMKAQERGGAIVNTASVAGLAGGIAPQAYSAAKAAVISFTKTTALELAPEGIRVNSVSPGVIDTPLVQTGTKDPAAGMSGIQPWPESGQPDDIAAVIAFLAGDDARFVTGENIVIDGGLLAAGPRLGNAIGGDPASRGLAGINRGTTGQGHVARKVE
jgi:NAD(P)-dependent dehydrogenase (short-subunit alcohol dehydrogenase family)